MDIISIKKLRKAIRFSNSYEEMKSMVAKEVIQEFMTHFNLSENDMLCLWSSFHEEENIDIEYDPWSTVDACLMPGYSILAVEKYIEDDYEKNDINSKKAE